MFLMSNDILHGMLLITFQHCCNIILKITIIPGIRIYIKPFKTLQVIYLYN